MTAGEPPTSICARCGRDRCYWQHASGADTFDHAFQPSGREEERDCDRGLANYHEMQVGLVRRLIGAIWKLADEGHLTPWHIWQEVGIDPEYLGKPRPTEGAEMVRCDGCEQMVLASEITRKNGKNYCPASVCVIGAANTPAPRSEADAGYIVGQHWHTGQCVTQGCKGAVKKS